MMAPLAIFWLTMAAGLVSGRAILITAFFVAAAFGTMAVIPPAATAGVTVLPQVTCAMILCLWLAVRRGRGGQMAAAALDPRALGLLSLFLIFGVVVTAFLPVMLEGKVSVIPFRSTAPGVSPLAPTPSNLTQIFYLAASCATAVSFHVLWRDPAAHRKVLTGLLAGGAALVICGLADLATRGTDLLAPFRTATYALLTNDDVMGVKRVVGLMSEASAYGGGCVGFGAALYFLRGSFAFLGARRWVLTLTLAGLFAMTVASTSSSAYAGLGVFAMFATGDFVRRFFIARRPLPRADFFEDVAALFLLAGAVAGAVLLAPHAVEFAASLLDRIVFQKAESSSFAERSSWNAVAMRALEQSHWLGVGIGSTRVSSWPIAVVSNAGVAGAAILAVFFLTLFSRRTDGLSAELRDAATGAKLAMLVVLSMASLAATTPDFGLLVGALIGTVSGLAALARATRFERPQPGSVYALVPGRSWRRPHGAY